MTEFRKSFFFGQLLSWATVWFLMIPLAPIATLWTTYRLWKGGQKSLSLVFLILSPFAVLPMYNVAKAGFDYSYGEATIGFLGYPNKQYSNVDPELRVRHTPEGSPTGTEYFTMYPYNSTVRWLIRKNGYQVGSYTGFLPTASEARSLLQSDAVELGNAILTDGVLTLTLRSSVMKLELDEQPDQMRNLLLKQPLLKEVEYVVQDDCLVVALNENWIYCIDVSSGIFLSHFLSDSH